MSKQGSSPQAKWMSRHLPLGDPNASLLLEAVVGTTFLMHCGSAWCVCFNGWQPCWGTQTQTDRHRQADRHRHTHTHTRVATAARHTCEGLGLAEDGISSQVGALQPCAHGLHNSLLHISHLPCTTMCSHHNCPRALIALSYCTYSSSNSHLLGSWVQVHAAQQGAYASDSRLVSSAAWPGLNSVQKPSLSKYLDPQSMASISVDPARHVGTTHLRCAQPRYPVAACCCAEARSPACSHRQRLLLPAKQSHPVLHCAFTPSCKAAQSACI